MAFLLERIAGPDSTDPSALASCNSRNDSSLKRVNSSIQSTSFIFKKLLNYLYSASGFTLLRIQLIANIALLPLSERPALISMPIRIGFHNEQFTKVVYFTERTVTPFLTVIPRRLGEISLRDFKTLFDRPGVYRFHFKAKDPEYGFVKEEVYS